MTELSRPVAEPAAGVSSFRGAGMPGLDHLVHAVEARATLGVSPVGQMLALSDWATHLANSPFRRLELMRLAAHQWRRLLEAKPEERVVPDPHDHRFQAPGWASFPFSFMEQAFLLGEEWWRHAAAAPAGTSAANARMVSFAMRQFVDMFSPSNVPWLNPEVISATVNEGGRNLLRGSVAWLQDLQAAMGGQPADALRVGQDVAATPGSVVFRNELMELIQYAPATPTVHREPVLIVPAWIMKYYILDLSPGNSLIRWLVGQGHTVFAISWRNPGPELRDTALEDYRTKGVMAALDAVTAICDRARVHAVGYCLGGTLLSIAAAAMGRDGDDRLASVTLFAAQTDFTEAGELQLFITEDQLEFLSDLMAVQGYLDSRQMAGAFQMLHSNDLLWSRAIRNYLLGQTEHPNDLMSWNADGTRMPARMHAEYLRTLFLDNDLAEGRFTAAGAPVAVGDIAGPLFVVGTETDHIAPWHSVFKLHLLNDRDLTFVLTSGGHNAGVVSEPGHPHRHFRLRTRPHGSPYLGPDAWLAAAGMHAGSWWPAWGEWLAAQSSGRTEPPATGSQVYKPLGAAPGSYVHEH